MNIGLMLQIVLSVLPVGLLQTWASVRHGYWYARSAEFLGTGWTQTLRWLRVPGDTLFAIGAIAVIVFLIGSHYGWSLEGGARGGEAEAARRVAA
jgi:nitric oxide reductase subunit B